MPEELAIWHPEGNLLLLKLTGLKRRLGSVLGAVIFQQELADSLRRAQKARYSSGLRVSRSEVVKMERSKSSKSANVDARSKHTENQVTEGVVRDQARQYQGNDISDSAPATLTARASLINLQTSNSQDSASHSPASLVTLHMASRRQSSTTSVVTEQSQRGSPNSLKFERPVDPSLESLTQFMNANLIQQKRLKANSSQITMAAKEFTKVKIQHEPSFARPPTTTSAIRAKKYADLHKLCSRYDNLIEHRRQILEKQQGWLEAALGAPVLEGTKELGFAIDMQIEAARELNLVQEKAELRKELKSLGFGGCVKRHLHSKDSGQL